MWLPSELRDGSLMRQYESAGLNMMPKHAQFEDRGNSVSRPAFK
jgi:hypothetical protein